MTSKQKLLRLRDEVIAERIEQRKDNKEYQDMTKFFDFHYSEFDGFSCFWAKKILTLISD